MAAGRRRATSATRSASAGFRRFARHNWRFGIDEMARSLSRRRFAAAVRRLCPRSSAPISCRRRPACARRRSAPTASSLDDFVIRTAGRAVHVLNAPSPAATASLEIGATIAAGLDLDD